MKENGTGTGTHGQSTRMFSNNFSLYGPTESDAAPLIVNSAGCQTSPPEFYTYNPNGRVDYYLLYMTEGRMPFFCNGQTGELLTPGSLIIIPPRTPYKYYSEADHPIKYFFVHFTGFYAGEYLKRYGFRDLPFRYDGELNPDIITKFQDLLYSFVAQKSFLNEELAARADSVLRALARTVLREQSPDKISRSLRYINRHYQEDIRISDLAQTEYLSVSRYIAVFREAMGMPPSQYLIRVRLNAACVLLRESDYSVKEIGSMVGYHEPHYFYNLFKRNIGMSPGEYRQAIGNAH